MYTSAKFKSTIKRAPGETEFVIKLYLLMKKRGYKFQYLTSSMKARGYSKFNRQFFINYFLLNLNFIPFSTLCHIMDILKFTFADIESVNIPEEIKRKYIK